jgi:hypothetical protein
MELHRRFYAAEKRVNQLIKERDEKAAKEKKRGLKPKPRLKNLKKRKRKP